MIAQSFIGKKRRMGAAACYAPKRHAAMLAAAFAAITLGVADQASAHRSPDTSCGIGGVCTAGVCVGGSRAGENCAFNCTTNGSGASITFVAAPGVTDLLHGSEICFQVGVFNTCPSCCDVTNLGLVLNLPNGSSVPIATAASLRFGQSFSCPGDARCTTASTCTLSDGAGGTQVGYKYIISHANEHGPTGVSCPPTPASGFGEISAEIHSTSGTVHLTFHVGASLCKAIATDVNHACCEPCTGTCTVGTAAECPFPSVFHETQSCAETVCTPVVCAVPVPPCEAGQTCDLATGLCVDVRDPLSSTPCANDTNPCTTDHCDGLGHCVPLSTACDDPNFCDDHSVCTTDRCSIDLPQCCENLPISCPFRPCFRNTGCDPILGCQYTPDCRPTDTDETGAIVVCCPDDGNPCTREFCVAATGLCGSTPDCRTTATNCCPDDGNPCTEEFCNQATGLCGSTPECRTAADCEDGLRCTVDTCVNFCCERVPLCGGDTNPNPECTGATCATFIPCNPGSGCIAPVCATTDQGGVCLEGATGCAGLPGCTTSADCPGAAICAVNTCCGGGVCIDPSLFCTTSGAAGAAPQAAAVQGPTVGGDNTTGRIAALEQGICCADGASCDDNDACTDEECVDGCCEYSPHVCPSRNCFDVVCDVLEGCIYTFNCNSGKDCCPDDGNPCTHEFCDKGGTCGSIPDCTSDTGPDPECAGQTCDTFTNCNPNSACAFPVCGSTAEGGGLCVEGATPCDGLAPCTTSAECTPGLCFVDSCCGSGVCVPVEAFCPDIAGGAAGVPSGATAVEGPTIAQRVGSLPVTRTVPSNVAAACEDQDACFTGACENSCCVQTPIDCPFKECQRNTGCDPINGCQYVFDCRSDAAAGDGVFCCPDDGNACTHEFCNQATGQCGSTPDCTTRADCEDGLKCTVENCVNSCCVRVPLCGGGTNPDPQCSGQTCETFTGCNPNSSCAQPVCGSTAEGGGLCVEGATPCSGLAPCSTSAECTPGLCFVNSCCGIGVCVPPEAFCPEVAGAAAVVSPGATAVEGPTIGGENTAVRSVPVTVLEICCADGASCNDHDACTDDECADGCCAYSVHVCPPCNRCDSILGCVPDCRTGSLTDCCPDDGNQCTVEFCKKDGTCGRTGNADCCPPNDPLCCDSNDDCDDDWACTDDHCDFTSHRCVNTPNDDHCNDHFSCTTDRCVPDNAGADPISGCKIRPDNSVCRSFDQCRVGVCDPKNWEPLTGPPSSSEPDGCTLVPGTPGISCESDGDPCTVERCSDFGICQVFTPTPPPWPISQCPPEAAYYLAVVEQPTSLSSYDEVDDKGLPPCGAAGLDPGQTFYVEVYVTEFASTSGGTGIACANVNLRYNPEPRYGIPINQNGVIAYGSAFHFVPTGISDGHGNITRLGACTDAPRNPPPPPKIGVFPRWALLARIKFIPQQACGEVRFQLSPSGFGTTVHNLHGSPLADPVDYGPACRGACRAHMYDLDNDCQISPIGDWALFAGCWLQCPGDPGYAVGLNGKSCDGANFVGFCNPGVSNCCTPDNCVGPEDFPFMWGAVQEAIYTKSLDCSNPYLKLPFPCLRAETAAEIPSDAELQSAGLEPPPADWKGYDRGILREIGKQKIQRGSERNKR